MPLISTVGNETARGYGFGIGAPFPVNYLIVAGGGTSGYGTSWAGISGGGAGGMLTGSNFGKFVVGQSYSIVIGAGGAGATAAANNGNNSTA